ncbi:hypothetical protein [Flavobacterium sp. CLA17]|uniref:hypothetical protein n=1 Tax=Flavobacterium sp. CLA17 TaxID=2724135 RepID=UPI0014928D42|nr:hypothetical protein [Flavobacterium sp. CLA17]QSB29055.1 hypothetical protein HAV12_010050 [Flavobacterium sp. CLA17]
MNTANPTKSGSYTELQKGEHLYCTYRTIKEQLLNWGEDPKYPENELSNDFNKHLNQEDDLDNVDSYGDFEQKES